MNILQVKCDSCKVVQDCPKKGSSPLKIGKTEMLCRVIGGYGRDAVNPEILSSASKEKMDAHGPCLTIVEVPVRSDDGSVSYEIEKVFHHPIKHERETVPFNMEAVVPRAAKIT